MLTTTLNPTINREYAEPRTYLLTLFLDWCTSQENNRLLWLAIAITFHGCVLTPLTVLIVAMTGINLLLLFVTGLAMSFVLIVNLAALPTKYTLPVLIFSIIMDITVIITAFAMA